MRVNHKIEGNLKNNWIWLSVLLRYKRSADYAIRQKCVSDCSLVYHRIRSNERCYYMLEYLLLSKVLFDTDWIIRYRKKDAWDLGSAMVEMTAKLFMTFTYLDSTSLVMSRKSMQPITFAFFLPSCLLYKSTKTTSFSFTEKDFKKMYSYICAQQSFWICSRYLIQILREEHLWNRMIAGRFYKKPIHLLA